jgi:hypothetical protein
MSEKVNIGAESYAVEHVHLVFGEGNAKVVVDFQEGTEAVAERCYDRKERRTRAGSSRVRRHQSFEFWRSRA